MSSRDSSTSSQCSKIACQSFTTFTTSSGFTRVDTTLSTGLLIGAVSVELEHDSDLLDSDSPQAGKHAKK